MGQRLKRCYSDFSRLEYDPVTRASILKAIDGFIDLRKGKLLHHGRDAVTGAKLKHECRGGWAPKWGTGE
jgi:hypothetical protein